MKARWISKAALAAVLVGGAAVAQPVLAHGTGYGQGHGHGGAGMHGPCGGQQGMMGHGMGMMGYGTGMMGPGTMGPGMMSPGMMGQGQGATRPGMMGQGQGAMGPGTMGRGGGMMSPGLGGSGYQGGYRDRDLTVEEVRGTFEHRLEHHGNERLRVGAVEARDDDVIVADIETVDGSLVERYAVDRHSGRMQRAQ